ncbi:MAG: hypothetical protein AAB339_08960, partial [Elusimicrobiota bacterium]
DEDWFFVDAPDDGKAHIIRIDVVQEAGTGADIAVYSGQDNSSFGPEVALSAAILCFESTTERDQAGTVPARRMSAERIIVFMAEPL